MRPSGRVSEDFARSRLRAASRSPNQRLTFMAGNGPVRD
jgi:hypothetical protein